MRLTLILIILLSCDFETPAENHLVDSNQPVNFFNINQVETRINRVGLEGDFTDSIDWFIQDDLLQFEIQTDLNGADSLIYVFQPNYIISMETNKYFSLQGVDSIVPVIDIDIINTNPHYDNVDRLKIFSSQLLYKTIDDLEFQPIPTLDSLLNIQLDMKFKYVVQIASGYSYHFGVIPVSTFFLNSARYKIRFNILGFYLE